MNQTSKSWLDLLLYIMNEGELQDSREGLTKEILNANLDYPISEFRIQVPKRNLNQQFILEEAQFVLSGHIIPGTDLLKHVLKAWLNEFGIYSGSYGPQYMGQLDYILETLSKKPDSRQAVMTIWKDNPRPQLNVPCLTQMQFLIRKNKLNCFATMRSSDAYLGLPNDIGVFALMAQYVAHKLNIDYGTMYLNMHSCHIYEKHWIKTHELITEYL